MIDIFAYPDIHFPHGFLWGASTAGEQVEGNGKSYHDDPETAPKTSLHGAYEFPGKACDSFERYKDDIALLNEMNLSLYRFSIEWSRLEPEKGAYDPAALKRYLDMLRAMSGRTTCTPVSSSKARNTASFKKVPPWATTTSPRSPESRSFITLYKALRTTE